MRWCAWHKTVHPIEEFGRNKRHRDGLNSYCKDGAAQYRRMWWDTTSLEKREARRERDREYYRKNRRPCDGPMHPYRRYHPDMLMLMKAADHKAEA